VDRGTSKLGNVDISGGAIDKTVIGNSSPAEGTFSALSYSTISTPSDSRHMADVEEVSGRDALASVLNWRPVTFRPKASKSQGATFQLGFIAQEVRDSLPARLRDGLVSEDLRGVHGLDYGRMSTLIAKAIQQLTIDFDGKIATAIERLEMNFEAKIAALQQNFGAQAA